MKTALISVFNKEGIVEFAEELSELGWSIIASGGTAKALASAEIPWGVRDVAQIVGGGAILGHRVVTLSREIHAGLLARDNEVDNAELSRLGIPRIDLVCVDLYPLESEIAKEGSTLQSVIEMTDIGGPTMLRSAAKGRRIVVCDPADRQKVIEWLKIGEPNREEFINELAAKAEYVVAKYVLASTRYLSWGRYDGMIGEEAMQCKYGENAWQTPAGLFSTDSDDPLALDKFQVVTGTSPSYNNLCDVDRLLQTVTHIAAGFELNRGYVPRIAVAVKHGNACGAAFGISNMETLEQMIIGDEVAIFGGLVMTNFALTEQDADVLLNWQTENRRLLDGVIAPAFTESAVEMFKRKGDKCRLLANLELLNLGLKSLDRANRFRYVRGGFLRQPNYTYVLDLTSEDLKKFGSASESFENALILVWAVGSTSNSNTITVGHKGGYLIGNAVGQQSRVAGCKLARMRIKEAGHASHGTIVYSDSFFPFLDGPEVLEEMGVEMILSSSGSVADEKVIKFCHGKGIVLYMMPDDKGRGFYGH